MQPPANPDAIWHALMIQLKVTPKNWPEALLQIPEAMRPRAEQYLRDQARLMRNRRALRRE